MNLKMNIILLLIVNVIEISVLHVNTLFHSTMLYVDLACLNLFYSSKSADEQIMFHLAKYITEATYNSLSCDYITY